MILRFGFFAVLYGLALASVPAQAVEPCTEINVQTIAENRLKDGLIGERQVGVFFAGASVNALADAEKEAIESELDHFFHAFRKVFVEHKYHWRATPDVVERARAQFDYLVVFDSELNVGALPKYNANLDMYEGKPIDPGFIGFVDYVRASDMNASVPAAFAQVVDEEPVGSSVIFAEFILLVLGAHLSIHSCGDY